VCTGERAPRPPSTAAYTQPRGPVAQLVEQGTFNPKVAGSIPARPMPDVATVTARLAGTSFELGKALDTPTVACAESGSLRPDRWDWLEVREYLVLKDDGKTERFPVLDGDVAQARLRAALVQRPTDSAVVVTEDAYIRVRLEPPSEHGRPAVG
jgi:hypothetical protein